MEKTLLKEIAKIAIMKYKLTNRNKNYILDIQYGIDKVCQKYNGVTQDAYGSCIINNNIYIPNVYGDEDTLQKDLIGRLILVKDKRLYILTISRKFKKVIKEIKLSDKIDLYMVGGKRGFCARRNIITIKTNWCTQFLFYKIDRKNGEVITI